MLLPAAAIGAQDYAQWQTISAPSAEDSPIFVVGFPRSGTTMLETMLDAHERLTCMDERPFVHNLVQQMREQGSRISA